MVNVRKKAENFNTVEGFAGSVLFDEPMSLHTTFKVGGPAAVFVEPETETALKALCAYLLEEDVPFFVLGSGSNLVVADEGMECVVISTRRLLSVSVDEAPLSADELPAGRVLPSSGNGAYYRLHLGAGATMDAAARYCEEKGLSGLEAFAGLPGTAGGAIFMNARCYGASVSDILLSADWLDPDAGCSTGTYRFEAADWDYKRSPFQNSRRLVLSADFIVGTGDAALITAEGNGHRADREKKGHFTHPSAGSVFKNDRAFGKPSGQIIDEAGLRGLQIGGAQIAPWHGNFIINTGNASARDIRQLVDHVVQVVKEKTGFVLEPEILFV